MAWYVYVARCRDGSLYAGASPDPAARLRQHNAGRGSAYIRSRRPARLVYRERCGSRGRALRREAEIKGWPRPIKLALIRSARMLTNGRTHADV